MLSGNFLFLFRNQNDLIFTHKLPVEQLICTISEEDCSVMFSMKKKNFRLLFEEGGQRESCLAALKECQMGLEAEQNIVDLENRKDLSFF